MSEGLPNSARPAIVGQAIARVVRRPYEFGRNDCVTLAVEVYGACSAQPVAVPEYWRPGETALEVYRRMIDAHGSVAAAHLALLQQVAPRPVPVARAQLRVGDIWLQVSNDYPQGVGVGVIDPAFEAVHWTEDGMLAPAHGFPRYLWTVD